MKLLFTLPLFLLLPLTSFSQQLRLQATAFYNYDAAQSVFYLADSSRYGYKVSRPNVNPTVLGYSADTIKEWMWLPPTGPLLEASVGLNSFDATNHIIQNLGFGVNNGSLDSAGRVRYIYNSQGLETSNIREVRNSGNWLPQTKHLSTYDTQGNQTEFIDYDWDFVLGSWVNKMKYNFTYSGTLQTERYIYQWINGVWASYGRTLYHHNGLLLDSTFNQNYNPNIGQWINGSLEAYHYNSSNDIDTIFYQGWGSSLQWEPLVRSIIITDNNHNWLTAIVQGYVNSAYKSDRRDRYTYNAANLETSAIADYWDTATSQFVFKQYSSKYYRYYEANAAGITGPSSLENTLRLYPNPAASILHVSLQAPSNNGLIRLSVSDIFGKVIKSWYAPATVNFNSTVDVSDLPAGNYLLRCSGSQFAQQQFSIIR